MAAPRPSRHIPVTPETATPAQRAVHDAIKNGPRGHVRGPFPVLLHSPGMADQVQKLGAYVRFGSKMPDRLRELAVLTTSRFWRAEFEWFAHAPLAEKFGIPPAAIEAIRAGATPRFADAADQTVYDFIRELHERHNVGDETYRRAQEILGQEVVTDLIGMAGYYTLLAMILNVYEVPLPDGTRPFPA